MVMYPSGSWRGDLRAFDAFDSAVLLLDRDGVVEFANVAARRRFVDSDSPLTGVGVGPRLFAQGEQSAVEQVLAEVRSGVAWRGQLSVLEGGSPRAVEAACWPLAGRDAVTGMLLVLERAGGDSAALRQARRLADRFARLARVTSDLVMADTTEAVTKIVISHTAEIVGATIASLTVREDEHTLHLLGLKGARRARRDSGGGTRSPRPPRPATRSAAASG